MRKICVYVMTHDNGFAPRLKRDTLILHGCKKYNIEKNAQNGDWIVGVGGRQLADGKYDGMLIYAMKVEENQNNAPQSSTFYYFGDKAIKLKGRLRKFIRKDPTKHIGCNYFHYEKYKYLFSDFEELMKNEKVGMIGDFIDQSKKPKACPTSC